jgi:putative FmdB family regulatory protein
MPIYVYECAKHGIQEHNVTISQRDTVKCFECAEDIVRRIVFQGSVWAPTAKGGHAR